MNKLLYSWLWRSLYQDDLVLLRDFRELLKLTHRLELNVQKDRLQELYIQFLQKRWVPHVLQLEVAPVSIPTYGSPMLNLSINHDAASPEAQLPNIRPFVKLGQLLAIDMKPWLALLQYAIAQNPGAAKFAIGG